MENEAKDQISEVPVKDLGEVGLDEGFNDNANIAWKRPRINLLNKRLLKPLITFMFVLNLLSLFAFLKERKYEYHMVVSEKEFSLSQDASPATARVFDIQKDSFPQFDDYSSRSVLVFDLNANAPIYKKNADSQALIASLTKLASTKVLSDHVDPNAVTKVDENVEKIEGGAFVLKKDNEFINSDLIKAAIVVSNNQSVFALNSKDQTVGWMNSLAKSLKLQNTHFSNPAGFDDGGSNYSTADDLVQIAKVFFQDETLKMYAGMDKTEVHELNTDKFINISNTNDLVKLHTTQVIAGKTGTTDAAGQNLLLLAEKNGRQYIIILLNGTNRYEDAYKVLGRL